MRKLKVIDGAGPGASTFECLIRPHYEVLYRTAYRWTRSVEDAEDLVQEVCVRAYPRLTEIARLEQPRAWLMRVMYRLFVDLTRRYERHHVQSLETAGGDTLACEQAGPAERAERAFAAEALERAWQHIDAEHRALLAMHDIEGYTLAELTEMTGLKEGTLKSRLHRARVRLGRLLQRRSKVVALETARGGKR